MKTKIYVLNSKLFAVILIVLTILAGFSSCDDDEDMENNPVAYSGSFVKSSETVVTSATGTTTATYNPVTLELSYMVTWTGLGSNAVNMHFHNDGPVMAPITGFAAATSGTVSGKVTLTAQQATDLAAGKIYTQIHTEDYPGGEVIATLSKSAGSNNQNQNPPGGDGY
ncbi:MAG: CHRD domain-containing protein [Prolixibacteraceae bacterium]